MRKFGPGLLVTAAFIGPGTVTTASLAGARFGYTLMWALIFSVFATMVLQEMAIRLGLYSGMDLGAAIRNSIRSQSVRFFAVLLVLASLVIGNSAFQTGNLLGAALGLEIATGGNHQLWIVVVSALAFGFLFNGRYQALEKVLILLVALMSMAFIGTFFMLHPGWDKIFAGMKPVAFSDESVLTVIALIGTTVVPYNLFLHAGAVKVKWGKYKPVDQSLHYARRDSFLSIGLGGLITLAILSTAASSFFVHGIRLGGVTDLAGQLEPLLGVVGKQFFAIGLLAAGMTSAITAPFAAGLAAAGVMGWSTEITSWRFRMVWMFVLGTGTLLTLLDIKPINAIVVAQVVNGLLLPVIAFFLLRVMNNPLLLGSAVNGKTANVLGGLIVLVTLGLGMFQISRALGVL